MGKIGDKWKDHICGDCVFQVDGECMKKAPMTNYPRNRVEGHFPAREPDRPACADFEEDK